MTDGGAWAAHEERLRTSAAYQALRERLGTTERLHTVERLPPAAAAWVLGLLAKELGRPLLVVVPHEVEAYGWLEAARLFLEAGPKDAVYVPAPSLSPYQETEISLAVRAEESIAVDRIVRGTVSTVLCTPRTLYRRLPEAQAFPALVRTIAIDEEHPVDELAQHLTDAGYHRVDLVVEIGQFAVRGGVFDIFPPGQPQPIRLDLFGDTVESIQRFEPDSQRSVEHLDTVRLLPLGLFPESADDAELLAELLAEMAGPEPSADVAEHLGALRREGGFPGWQHHLPLIARRTVSVAELMSRDGHPPLVAALEPDTLLREIVEHDATLQSEVETRRDQRRLAVDPEALEHTASAVATLIEQADVHLSPVLDAPSIGAARGAIDFESTQTPLLHNQLPRLPREIETARTRGEGTVLVVPGEHRSRIRELLEAREITFGPSELTLVDGDLVRGFRLPAAGVTIFGERQLFQRSPLARPTAKRKRRFGPFLSSMRDLKIGDYVVHADHGIGQFVGLRKLAESAIPGAGALPPALRGAAKSTASDTEVMEINYASGKSLLLPLSRLDQVQKYSGIEGVAPRLDRLGGTSWQKTKKRIKRGMRDMAQELLKLYAERQLAKAPAMPPDSDLQRQFESSFAFDPTPDQVETIEAIKLDLENQRPMDRLLCGDVGFGKTEVAMRAAFKAVDSGFQVAVLAPTTILADQHLETFTKRFREFPVTIDMVSRFRSTAEVRDVQKRATEGKLDILIGTHRLLGKGFSFPKLGLLIIDEEQRFGVAQKEKLKQLRKDVHVLAMSATPVPRTLQLSLAGVRDLSLIETPPRDRMAVETAILPFDPQLVREAVAFEVERGGQVYFVYNNVETIDGMASFLRELMPSIRLTVGHGQMDEQELARRMHAFIDGEFDLLLATTIIENGIDIPNVNTMIVHQAERFGLSQLYQLRGRVGRSDQLAYCYLLVPTDRILSEQARKRLHAIREFTELGAGFRVAGRDLEIRGAGNLLGAEQSGHIAAVGIETYMKMLEETVAEMKGEAPADLPSVTMDLPVPMSIPETYVDDPNLRIEIYHRIVTSQVTREAVLDELRDRFGPPPDAVLSFLDVVEVKRLAESMRLQSIAARGGKLTFRLRQDAHIDPNRLIALVSERPDARFSPTGVLTLEGVATSDLVTTARSTLERLGS